MLTTLPERYLLIGDEGDVPLLGAMLEAFPERAAGNVVLELPTARCPRLPLPPGMTLSVLPRGTGPRGVRAAAALEAWVQEWLTGAHEGADMHAVWVGMPGDAVMDRLCADLLHARPSLHLHRAYEAECAG